MERPPGTCCPDPGRRHPMPAMGCGKRPGPAEAAPACATQQVNLDVIGLVGTQLFALLTDEFTNPRAVSDQRSVPFIGVAPVPNAKLSARFRSTSPNSPCISWLSALAP